MQHPLFQRAAETFKTFDESKVVRHGKGDSRGGQFAPKHGGDGGMQPSPPRSKKKPRPEGQARPKPPRKPITPSKPSPFVERVKAQREQQASQPASQAAPSPAIAAAGAAKAAPKPKSQSTALVHKTKAISPDESKLPDQTKLTVQREAASLSQAEASKMAVRYQGFADVLWNMCPVKRDDYHANPRSSIVKRLEGADKNYLKKALEFDQKAGLWSHFAENPDEAKKPPEIELDEDLAFEDMVDPVESNATTGPGYIPTDWDELDKSVQRKIKQDWIENRITDNDFLDWVYDDIESNLDTREVLEEKFDEVIDNVPWANLDVGQQELANDIELTAKEAHRSGLVVGQKMTDSDKDAWRAALTEAAGTWHNGDLDDDQVKGVVEETILALAQSADGEINLPTDDELADNLQIDRDDAIEQLVQAYDDGEQWAEKLLLPVRAAVVADRLEDEETLQPYAESEWDNMGDSSEWLSAGQALGIIPSEDDQVERTTPELRSLGIDDAVSFVGAPDDTYVTFENGNVIRVEGPGGFAMKRTIGQDGVTIFADELSAGEYSGSGSGTGIVAQMIRQARLHGFQEIQTYAAGELGDTYNGYYTWPLMGYDQSIKGMDNEANIRADYPNAKTVQDVFASPGGRDWWYMNGVGLEDATFDLTDGSRSMQVLESYLNERRRKNS